MAGFSRTASSRAALSAASAVSASALRKQQVVIDFRRAEILGAATKVFARKGFDATRMEDVAQTARLAKGTLYRYFKSKDAIYDAVVQHALAKLAVLTEERVRTERDLAGKLAAFIATRIAFWNEHHELYRIILSINRQVKRRKRSYMLQKAIVLYLRSILEEAAKAGEIPRQDFLAAAWATMDAIRGVNERVAFAEERSQESKVKFLTAFLLSALGAKGARKP